MKSLRDLIDWLAAAPVGTSVDARGLLAQLEPLLTVPASSQTESSQPVLGWREKLWTVPADTRLGKAEVAEAIGRPVSWVYRHTSEKAASGSARLPHRKLDGELVFVAGEIRRWMQDNEETIQAGRQTLALSPRRVS